MRKCYPPDSVLYVNTELFADHITMDGSYYFGVALWSGVFYWGGGGRRELGFMPTYKKPHRKKKKKKKKWKWTLKSALIREPKAQPSSNCAFSTFFQFALQIAV